MDHRAQQTQQAEPRTEPDRVQGSAISTPLATSDARLDRVLGGGYPLGTAVLLHGPSFCGKQQLLQGSLRHALRMGWNATLVLHNVGAAEMSQRLSRSDAITLEAEATGRLAYVDAVSPLLGESKGHPGTAYVEDPTDLEALLAACGRSGFPPARHLLVVEALGTLLKDLGQARAAGFLRAVTQPNALAGGVVLVGLQGEAHSRPDLEMARTFCASTIEMQRQDNAYRLRADGFAGAPPAWLDYAFDPDSFQLL